MEGEEREERGCGYYSKELSLGGGVIDVIRKGGKNKDPW